MEGQHFALTSPTHYEATNVEECQTPNFVPFRPSTSAPFFQLIPRRRCGCFVVTALALLIQLVLVTVALLGYTKMHNNVVPAPVNTSATAASVSNVVGTPLQHLGELHPATNHTIPIPPCPCECPCNGQNATNASSPCGHGGSFRFDRIDWLVFGLLLGGCMPFVVSPICTQLLRAPDDWVEWVYYVVQAILIGAMATVGCGATALLLVAELGLDARIVGLLVCSIGLAMGILDVGMLLVSWWRSCQNRSLAKWPVSGGVVVLNT